MSSLRAILYNAAGHDEDIPMSQADVKSLRKDQLLWIDGTAAEIADLEHLPNEIAAGVSQDSADMGLEILEPFYRFTVPSLPNRKTGKTHAIGFVVGKSWLLTTSDPRPKFMDSFLDTDRGETLNGRLTPSALAVALLIELLDEYRCELSHIDTSIDTLDDKILAAESKLTPLETLARLRRQVSVLRRALDEAGNAIHALTRPDFFAHVTETDKPFFETLGRSYERLEDNVARARETVIGSFELYTTRVAQDTNRLVKALTIATVITGIIGAAAGIFGMNFDTPFSHSGMAGFVDVTLVMIASSLAIVGIAVWRRWF